jgi:hypothetical protein
MEAVATAGIFFIFASFWQIPRGEEGVKTVTKLKALQRFAGPPL